VTTRFERSSELPFAPSDVFAWHARPGAFERLVPPWEDIAVVRSSGGIEAGAEVELRMRRGGLPVRWMAKHTACEPGRSFRDEQASGPFRSWVHEHRFEATDGGSRLVDSIEFAPPLEALTSWAAAPILLADLTRTFAFRHARTRADMTRHERYQGLGSKTIVVSGASGMLGRALGAFLSTGGHRVLRLVRGAAKSEDEIAWDPAAGTIDAAKLEGVYGVVHLSGENVGEGRWTSAKKRAIEESRTKSTALLARTIAGLARKPEVFVSASAIGLYGNRGDEPLDESSARGTGFLADVCDAWEAATAPAKAAGIRTVLARLGVVLSAKGGALAKLLPVFKLGAGGPVGGGRQVMSWIALDDVVYAMLHVLATPSLEGPVNFVAPEPATNAEFGSTLGRVLHRPSFMPTPAFAIELAFGEMGRETVLASQRVEPKRLLGSGFAFEFPSLEGALRAELGATKSDA
jgi:uncharacterized protein (TIGR01777 family)